MNEYVNTHTHQLSQLMEKRGSTNYLKTCIIQNCLLSKNTHIRCIINYHSVVMIIISVSKRTAVTVYFGLYFSVSTCLNNRSSMWKMH